MYLARPAKYGRTAGLIIEERNEDNYLVREVEIFKLRYLPDTHEVVLVKTTSGSEPEAVYSELLKEKP
jgi:hypothetical protein